MQAVSKFEYVVYRGSREIMPEIDIVLATFNGERYLKEQINSIQKNGGYKELVARFIIVDDGSTDKTVAIIKSFQSDDLKIELHCNKSEKSGPMQNFEFGINLTSAEYIMLSDQDDVWLSNKIQCTFDEANQQSEEAKSAPFVIFSDLKIVDEHLLEISHSYFSHKKMPKTWHENFDNLLQQNAISGCTMLFNRKLINIALPMPEKAYMHDWWLSLVAKKFGRVVFIDVPLLLYRQHAFNSIGAKTRSLNSYTIKLKKNINQFFDSFSAICSQAKVFDQRFKNRSSKDTLFYLANWDELNRREKLKALYQKKIRRSNVMSNLLLLIYIIVK